eukprot:scaffold531485_cov32-Prasinocladus_malaysianus.AAC.1
MDMHRFVTTLFDGLEKWPVDILAVLISPQNQSPNLCLAIALIGFGKHPTQRGGTVGAARIRNAPPHQQIWHHLWQHYQQYVSACAPPEQ